MHRQFLVKLVFLVVAVFYISILYSVIFSAGTSHSSFTFWGASARPFTFRRSAVFRNCGSWSCNMFDEFWVLLFLVFEPTWATFTSPAYMNSKIAVKCWNGTSLRMMIGCLAGFSSRRDLKYGLHAERIILCALQLWPSEAIVTSVKDFSSLRCLKEATYGIFRMLADVFVLVLDRF